MEFCIRKAGADDLGELVRLNRFVQEMHAEREPECFRPFDEEGITEHLLNALREEPVTFLLAEGNGRGVGYIMARVQDRPGHAYSLPRKFLELEQLAVEPESRGQGVGSALMDAGLALAARLGIGCVELSAWEFNESARRLFARKGFRPCLQRMRVRL